MKYDGKYQNMTIDFTDLIQHIEEYIDTTLEDYVKNTDYASNNTGGVIRTATGYGTTIANNGQLYSQTKTFEDYGSASNSLFISKGTLENVITGKNLDPTKFSGYDATKTQTLKNVEGTLTWVDDVE